MVSAIARLKPRYQAVEVGDSTTALLGQDGNLDLATAPMSHAINPLAKNIVKTWIDETDATGIPARKLLAIKLTESSAVTAGEQLDLQTNPFLSEQVSLDEPPIDGEFRIELVRAGHPKLNVRCYCDDQKLILSGSVKKFYHVQLAIEAARKLAGGRRIDVRIDVDSQAKAKPVGQFDNDFLLPLKTELTNG